MQYPPSQRRRLSAMGASCAVALLLSLSGPTVAPAFADDAPPAAAQAPRKEIADIFNAAKTLAVDKKYPEALAKLDEADAIPNHTPFEDGLLNQLRVIAALQTDNFPLAIKALGAMPDNFSTDQREKYVIFIASHYFDTKDYPTAIEWAKRYLAEGGPDRDRAEKLLGRAYYLTKDYPDALQSSLDALAKEETAGTVPNETDLEIFAEVAAKTKDTPHYTMALTKLVTYYPTPERWDDLIHQFIDRPSYPRDKRALDIFRLLAATGAMTRDIQFNDYAIEALAAGFPGEASQALDRSPDAGKATPLRAKVRKDYDVDQKSLATAERDAEKSPSGDVLVKLGVDYYGYAQYDKAISLIQAGIAKGGLKSPDDANLDLGIVYLAAGQKDKAIETLKLVTKNDGPAELAQAWIVKANSAH